MLRRIAYTAFLVLVAWNAFAHLPDSVFVGGQLMHVQGLALDRDASEMYFSFTDKFIKTDLDGNVLAAIDSIPGHLGAMTRNPRDGKVYASLEVKDDAIGNGIAEKLKIDKVAAGSSEFFVAVIDPRTMTMEKFRIDEACLDYNAPGHRYGCSGIDGVAIGPKIGSRGGKMYLYVAYGIYSDLDRDDNDDQILLRYDLRTRKLKDKYFIRTGNTNYGVQNLAYDPFTGQFFMAVYRGRKAGFPNHDLFAFDASQKPVRKGGVARLQLGSGWYFPFGSTGLCPLGDGLWYISHNFKDRKTGGQCCNARLYRWAPEEGKPFVPR